jgi:hypothetical protein
MRRIALLAIAAGFLTPLLASAPASAQATRTWVSGLGDDANPCSRTAPCKTFAGATSKTAAAGEINCIDPGGFGTVTITKALTINCHEVFGSILASGVPGVTVNAGVNDRVILRNLQIQGIQGGPNTAGTIGVRILAAAAVSIEDTVITQFSQQGIFDARTAGNTKLFVRNTTLSHNLGSGASIAGGSPNNAVFENVFSVNNVFGVAVATGNNLLVNRSVFSGNSNTGIQVDLGGQAVIDSSSISNNTTGLGATGITRLSNSDIVFNGTGISGAAVSYITNRIDLNTSNGTATVAAGGPTEASGQK